MSLFSRRTFLTLSLPPLAAACGFRPVYGPGGGAAGLWGGFSYEEPDDARSFVFVGRLEERLGPPSASGFRIDYTIWTKSDSIAIRGANETTRTRISGDASFEVSDPGTGAVLASGQVSDFSAYAATSSTLATASAKRDAEKRLMRQLADRIVTRLLSTAADWAR